MPKIYEIIFNEDFEIYDILPTGTYLEEAHKFYVAQTGLDILIKNEISFILV